MEKPASYCEYVESLPADNLHRIYHDSKYGFPMDSDHGLFGRLVLEINQAGLSWTTILKKADHFEKAYSGFEIRKVAGYGAPDIERLLNDSGIIRNRLKVNAAVHNARVILALQDESGSFKSWLDHHHPMPLQEWVKLFKKTFRFTGGEITNEFLVSTGYLEGAHIETCPIFGEVIRLNPPWTNAKSGRQ